MLRLMLQGAVDVLGGGAFGLRVKASVGGSPTALRYAIGWNDRLAWETQFESLDKSGNAAGSISRP
jgi:hypothetical protein